MQIVKGGLRDLESSVAVSQHHDAVTGTERQRVAYDYSYQLTRGLTSFHKGLKNVTLEQIFEDTGEKVQNLTFCNTNLTEEGCNLILETDNVLISIFNPGEEKTEILRFKAR